MRQNVNYEYPFTQQQQFLPVSAFIKLIWCIPLFQHGWDNWPAIKAAQSITNTLEIQND